MKIHRLMSILLLSMLIVGITGAYAEEEPLNNVANNTDKESPIEAGLDQTNSSPTNVENRSVSKTDINSALPNDNTISIYDALDLSDDGAFVSFVSWGDAHWYGENTNYFYDGDAVQSGSISDSSESWMSTVVTGAGRLKFYVSVSSEVDYDYLEFYIDGRLASSISGSVPWYQQRFYIGTGGEHQLRWRYVKDASVSVGNDAGYVDKLEYELLPTPINLTYPDGGETFVRGTTKTIKWNVVGNAGPNVRIELLRYGTVVGTVTSSTPNDGSFSWKISPTRALASEYKIRVTDLNDPDITDASRHFFTIGGINVDSPNYGEKYGENWVRGTTHTIKWSSLGNPGPNVRIDLLKNGMVVGTVTSSTPNDGSHPWKISTGRAPGIDYKIRVMSTTNSAYKDTSDNNFRIS